MGRNTGKILCDKNRKNNLFRTRPGCGVHVGGELNILRLEMSLGFKPEQYLSIWIRIGTSFSCS